MVAALDCGICLPAEFQFNTTFKMHTFAPLVNKSSVNSVYSTRPAPEKRASGSIFPKLVSYKKKKTLIRYPG